MDAFTSAYIECALWASTDDSGDPLDLNYGEGDIDPQTRDEMIADCKRFQDENSDDIATYEGIITCAEKAGDDFWLNRNGHGCGFWDGAWPEESGGRLDKASKAFGEYNLYVSGGTIYS